MIKKKIVAEVSVKFKDNVSRFTLQDVYVEVNSKQLIISQGMKTKYCNLDSIRDYLITDYKKDDSSH